MKPIQLLAVAAAGASLVAVPAFGGTEAPFVVTSPQARSVIEGASAVFAVAADGAQPLAYQWQRSGTELPGANGSSYVTAPVSLADSGAQLRVIITNAFGATTSSWATLTVTAANTITWTGAVSSDWNNPTNWSPRGVPGANDAVLVNSGTLNVAPNASFALLTLDGAATVTGSLRVSSTMNWNSGFVHASLVVEERGVLNLRGPFGRGLGGTLVNGGYVSLADGSSIAAQLSNLNVAITNLVGGTFTLQGVTYVGGVSISFGVGYGGPVPTFHNAGLLQVSAGTNTARLDATAFLNAGAVEVQSGTLRVNRGIIDSGTLNVAADSTVNLAGGSSAFAPGALSTGAGRVLLGGDVTGTLAGQNFQLTDAALVTGAFTLTGQLEWLEGFLHASVRVAAGGMLNLRGLRGKGLGGTLVNAGNVSLLEGGSLAAQNANLSVAVTNLAGGMFTLQGDSHVGGVSIFFGAGYAGSVPSFHNAGLLRVVADTHTAWLDATSFLNPGTVDVQSGSLRIYNGIAHSGALNVGAGSTVILAGGSSSFAPGALSAGAGRVLLGGTVTGTLVGQNFQITDGALVTGAFILAGHLEWVDGFLHASVQVAAQGALNLRGPRGKGLGGTLVNAGNLSLTEGGSIAVQLSNPEVAITNLPGATFVLQDGSYIGAVSISSGAGYAGPVPIFHNTGLLQVLAGPNAPLLDATAFLNLGAVDVQSGNLRINRGIAHSGTLNVGAGSTVTLAGGGSAFAPGAVCTGAGRVLLGGTVTGTLVGQNFQLTDAALVTGGFTLAGQLEWVDGFLHAAVKVADGGVLNLRGPRGKGLGGTLVNAGNISLTEGGSLAAQNSNLSVAITNLAGGTFSLHEGSHVGGVSIFFGPGYAGPIPTFYNAGRLQGFAGVGSASLDITGFLNVAAVEVQSGTLTFNHGYLQTAGTTSLGGGVLSATPININGGTLTGSGVINGSVVNAAEVGPAASSDTITINGSYTQTSAGTLRIAVGGPLSGQHARLAVNGQTTLDGRLEVSFSNGFVAGTGDFFDVLSYAARSGRFASSSAAALGLTESYTPVSLLLIAGSNAFPRLLFAASGSGTQAVCAPFQLHASATDVDGSVTNVAIFLDGSSIAAASGPAVSTAAELDASGTYVFIARALDNVGGTSWATQQVTLVAHPLHWLILGGFRANGVFKLCMQGEPTRTYHVEASDDLGSTSWSPLGLMDSTNGTWRFSDRDAANHAYRFYRAVSP